MGVVVSIIGKSNSGKTTLLERLIPELRGRGYRVAAIKHSAADFDIDRPGKDSWRYSQRNSDVVMLSSSRKIAMIKQSQRDMDLEELLPLIEADVDIILAEGFKQARVPKIEVHREGLGDLLCSPEDLIAVVTDEQLDVPVVQYSPHDIGDLADHIEQSLCVSHSGDDVKLIINNKPMLIDPSTKDVMGQALLGMVSAFGDVEEIDTLHVWLRKGKD